MKDMENNMNVIQVPRINWDTEHKTILYKLKLKVSSNDDTESILHLDFDSQKELINFMKDYSKELKDAEILLIQQIVTTNGDKIIYGNN